MKTDFTLRAGSGGSLPEGYMQIVDGLPIGPEVGSCGSAAFLNQTVVVQDIANDRRWATAKGLASQFRTSRVLERADSRYEPQGFWGRLPCIISGRPSQIAENCR